MVHLRQRGRALTLSMDKGCGNGETASRTLGLGFNDELTEHKVMLR